MSSLSSGPTVTTKSDQIRKLYDSGVEIAEIARRLGVRYQHVYNVINYVNRKQHPELSPKKSVQAAQIPDFSLQKPSLSVEFLLHNGFEHSGSWRLTEMGDLMFDRPLPKYVGVYVFALTDFAQYVGVATMGIAKRLYFYAKPGPTQRTSQRLNGIIKAKLQEAAQIDIYTASPPDLTWNDLPMHGAAGLELGLIKKFSLPWNMRSTR